MMDKCLRMALESPEQMDMYLELHTGREVIEHIRAALAERDDALSGALAWIWNSTEPDAIKHRDYDHLASNVAEIAKSALDGEFVDDVRAGEGVLRTASAEEAMRSYKQQKLSVAKGRWINIRDPHKPSNFSHKYVSMSDTEQFQVTLRAASARSKAKVSLPKMPWDEQP